MSVSKNQYLLVHTCGGNVKTKKLRSMFGLSTEMRRKDSQKAPKMILSLQHDT